MTLQFVNYQGQPLHICKPAIRQEDRKARAVADSFHKGWRVQGIPPGALERARNQHSTLMKAKSDPKPFSEQDWLRNATRKPIRAKPYSIPDAAQACAELASRAGWLRVEVVAIEKRPLNT